MNKTEQPNITDNVLVVEDDPEINELIGAYVEMSGFHYLRALTGQQGLNDARELHPSLVVLDLMLPDLDGFEVCKRLRGDTLTRDIPVIILTALDRDDARERGSACGAALYLTKPFDPDRLMDAIRRIATDPPPTPR